MLILIQTLNGVLVLIAITILKKGKRRRLHVNVDMRFALNVVYNGMEELNVKMQWIQILKVGLLAMVILVIVLDAKLDWKRYLDAII